MEFRLPRVTIPLHSSRVLYSTVTAASFCRNRYHSSAAPFTMSTTAFRQNHPVHTLRWNSVCTQMCLSMNFSRHSACDVCHCSSTQLRFRRTLCREHDVSLLSHAAVWQNTSRLSFPSLGQISSCEETPMLAAEIAANKKKKIIKSPKMR